MVIIIYGVCGFHCSLMPSVCSPQFLPQLSGCSPAWLPPCAVKQLGRMWPDFVVILLHCQVFCSALFSLACWYLAPGFSCSFTARESGLVEFCRVLFCQPLGIMRRKDRSRQGWKTKSCTEQLDAESASCAAGRMYSMTS